MKHDIFLEQEVYNPEAVGLSVAKPYIVDWVKYIVLGVVIVVPILIILLAPTSRWAVAFMAYINCLLYGGFTVCFLRKGTLGYLIPVVVPLWLIIGTCGGIIFFAMFFPNALYWTPAGSTSFFAGGVKYQLAICGFLLVYLTSMARLLRKENTVDQHPAMISKRMGYFALAIIVFAVCVEMIAWLTPLPLFLLLWAGRLFHRYKTVLFVVGAVIVGISRITKTWLVVFLVGMTFFYSLRNARAMALVPIAALICGVFFFSETKRRTKFALLVIAAIGIPLFLIIGNTTRVLLGATQARAASLEQQVAALKDWRLAAEQSQAGFGLFGRMYFTAGNVIVAYTPSRYPYRGLSPFKYAKEFGIYMLPDQLIRKIMGIKDPVTKLPVLFKTYYTGTWLLQEWGMQVTPTSSVEVSTIGHFWMLGGYIPVLFGGLAVALVHGLAARIIRRTWIKNPDKGIFYFGVLFYCFIWSMNWDFIQVVRNVLWGFIYAFVGYALISPLLRLGRAEVATEYKEPELSELSGRNPGYTIDSLNE